MMIEEAQRDLRRAYVGGGPGVLISALVWLSAAWVEWTQGIGPAFGVLFVGGMLIFPLSTLVSRMLFRRDREAAGNLLGRTALECTVAMIGGLFAAWLFMRFQPGFVFPLAAIAVGTHYAVFNTVYGNRIYWLLGGLMTALGFLGIYRPFDGMILAVAAVELVFGMLLTLRDARAGAAGPAMPEGA